MKTYPELVAEGMKRTFFSEAVSKGIVDALRKTKEFKKGLSSIKSNLKRSKGWLDVSGIDIFDDDEETVLPLLTKSEARELKKTGVELIKKLSKSDKDADPDDVSSQIESWKSDVEDANDIDNFKFDVSLIVMRSTGDPADAFVTDQAKVEENYCTNLNEYSDCIAKTIKAYNDHLFFSEEYNEEIWIDVESYTINSEEGMFLQYGFYKKISKKDLELAVLNLVK